MVLRTLVLSLLLVAAAAAPAQVTLPRLFSEHMVVQRDRPFAVWGKARPGEHVAVSLGQQTVSTRADAGGRWQAMLGPFAAGGPHRLLVSASNELVVDDVLVGEVWLCSGQSNMEWAVKEASDAEAELAAAQHPRIRLLEVRRAIACEPRDDIRGEWRPCTPESVAGFSAVGYAFGRELHQRLDVPIGLIESDWGGTPIEAWTSREALVRPDVAAALERWEETLAKAIEARVAWREAAAAARAAGQPAPEPPQEIDNPGCATVLYNGMIAPLVPFTLAGFLWYQGESNAGRAYQYRALFPAMIHDWRRLWGDPSLPFYFVQLASFDVKEASTWAELREAQLLTLALPRTGMAVATDLGDPQDIHPRNKREVGRRLSLWARVQCYGERELACSGPLYRRHARDGQALRIWFDHGKGLVARGGGALQGFEIATDSGDYVPAEARLEGDCVQVSSPRVAEPAHVRYGWTDDCGACNLVNEAGLPASPFRTDQRPGVTASAK